VNVNKLTKHNASALNYSTVFGKENVSRYLEEQKGRYGDDAYIKIWGKNILISRELQKHLVVLGQSNYECSSSILIIGEPHATVRGQLQLYKGLGSFVKDNQGLVEGLAFLSEGLSRGSRLSVSPLIQVEKSPNEKMIKEILGSFFDHRVCRFRMEEPNGHSNIWN